MLRHACGYALAAKGTDTPHHQDYLGHQNIQYVRYTELLVASMGCGIELKTSFTDC